MLEMKTLYADNVIIFLEKLNDSNKMVLELTECDKGVEFKIISRK